MLLAKNAVSEQSREPFHNLAQSWTRLAVELEQAQVLVTGINAMEIDGELQPVPTKPPQWRDPRLTQSTRARTPGVQHRGFRLTLSATQIDAIQIGSLGLD
jgi:hypothetical protein